MPLFHDDEIVIVRDAVRWYMGRKSEGAKKEAAKHERRLRDLMGEQQRLLQLYYRNGVDEEVMQVEQKRIELERSQASTWKRLAETQIEDVQQTLDKALELVTQPAKAYRQADPHILEDPESKPCSSASRCSRRTPEPALRST